MRVLSLVVLLSALLTVPRASLAQESAPPASPSPEATTPPASPAATPPPPAQAQAAAPSADAGARALDAVHLTNGGLLRGTIAEYIPGDHVVIVTITGETRRIPAAEIASVSTAAPPTQAAETQAAATLPAAEPTPQPQPAATARPRVNGSGARFRFESSQPGLILHRRAATAIGVHASALAYEPLCSAPCEASLPVGTHVLALSQGGDTPLALSEPTQVKGGETFDGYVRSRKRTRIGMMIMGGVIAVTGLLLALSADDTNRSEREFMHNRQRAAGVTLAVVGVGFGIAGPVLVRDRAELRLSRR